MLHPATTIKPVSRKIGLGVFATDFIPTGTIVYAKDPLEIEIHNHDPRLRDPLLKSIIERYSYTEPGGTRVLSWDLAKFMNHSCDPNTISTGYGFEIAIRDIRAGEHITDDYGLLNIETAMKCSCRSHCCRKTISPDDPEKYAHQWDAVIRPALAKLQTVEQPLAAVLDPVILKALDNFFINPDYYEPVIRLYNRIGETLQHQPELVLATEV